GARQLVDLEWILAGFLQPAHARGGDRVVGRRERQLLEDDERQRLAGDVDALPERRRGEEHRAHLGAERVEERGARALALDEDGVGHAAAQRGGGAAQRPPARRQDERAAARHVEELGDGGGGGGAERRIVRRGQVAREINQRLPAPVERRVEQELGGDGRVEPEAAAHVVEAAIGGERRRGEDRRRDVGENALLGQRRDLDRAGGRGRRAAPHLP